MKTPTVNRRTASYIVLGVTAVIIILTFFTATREFLYGIFGYAVYAYIPAALLTGILMYLGKKTTLPKSKVALYVALFFSALLTLHIALSKELVGEANYLTATYSGHTVGGALIGLPAALLHLIFPNYSFMLVAALVITAALLFAAIYPFVKDLGSGKKSARGSFTKRPRENDTEFRDSFKAAPKTAPKTAPLPEHFATESRDGDSDVVNVTGMSDEDFIKNYRSRNVSRSHAESILFEDESEEEKQSRFEKAFDIHHYTNQGMSEMPGNAGTSILFGAAQEREEEKRPEPASAPAPEEPKNAFDMLYTAPTKEENLTSYRKNGETPRPANPVMPKKRYDQYGYEIKDVETPTPEAPAAAVKAVNNRPDIDYNSGATAYPNTEIKARSTLQAPETVYSAPQTAATIPQTPIPQKPMPQSPIPQSTIPQSTMPQSPIPQKPLPPKVEIPAGMSGKDWLLTPVSPDEFRESGVFSDVLSEEKSVTAAIDEKYGAYSEPAATPEPEVVEVKPVTVAPARQRTEFQSDVMKKQAKPVFPTMKAEQTQMFGKDGKGAQKANERAEEEAPKKYVPKPYKAPPFDLLKDYANTAGGSFPSDYGEMKEKIETTMHEFSVPAEVVTAKRGPSFTTYYLKLGDGYKINKVTTLKDNLKMRLKVKNLRILAPIEGEDAFGIEIPNSKRDIVGLKFLLCSEEFNADSKGIRVAMGETFDGKPYIANLAKMPHLLVAGATGTGKSVFLNSVIISILYKYSPEDVRLIMIDPKRVEMSIYKGLPNLLVKEPVKEAKHAVNALKWLVEEMDRRYKLFENVGCRDIDEYNDLFRDKETEPKMPKIVLIIDEMADLMMTSKNSVEECVVRIAQLARACGIHMIIATQRPSVKVITGLIKANILHRVAFTVKSNMDSRVIMDDGGAEELLGNGDMLYSFPANLLRLQGALVETAEIQGVVKYIKENNEAYYDESIMSSITYEPPAPSEEPSVSPQELRDQDFEHLLRVVLKRFIMDGRASVSSVQTVHGVGYLKAKKLVDAMEERGFLGPQDGAKPRDILITMDEFYDIFGAEMDAEGAPTARDVHSGGEDE